MPCERCCPFTAAEDMRTPCLVDGPLRITRETLAPAAAGGDCQEAACNEAATYRLKGQGALDTNLKTSLDFEAWLSYVQASCLGLLTSFLWQC